MYVGYGGLPNADGVVQLDSCCMHGPLKRAGGVAALEGVRTPVARREGGARLHRPPPAGGRGRAGASRATWASRSRPTSTPSARARSGSSGSAASTPSTSSIPRSAREAGEAASPRDGARRACSTPPPLRHDQLRRRVARRARCAASPPPAGSPSRSPAAWATRRSWARASGWTTRSGAAGSTGPRRGQPLQPVVAS